MTIAYNRVLARHSTKQQADLWRLFNAISPDGETVTPQLRDTLASVIRLAHAWSDYDGAMTGLWKTKREDGTDGLLVLFLSSRNEVCMTEGEPSDWNWYLSAERHRSLMAA